MYAKLAFDTASIKDFLPFLSSIEPFFPKGRSYWLMLRDASEKLQSPQNCLEVYQQFEKGCFGTVSEVTQGRNRRGKASQRHSGVTANLRKGVSDFVEQKQRVMVCCVSVSGSFLYSSIN
jgi:hypothetical protein